MPKNVILKLAVNFFHTCKMYVHSFRFAKCKNGKMNFIKNKRRIF
ncbi:hypothetical protein RC62_407 [Flavobacterium aquidurense]|uniref:Uncharacterized protein n=1 Tax=Flavobacterium aquidurense TaxID=362413 RepID=A0A0N8VMX2_9FLAO|nr:hypothetical protein RC62_407 [Flavobacterium aquidurense]